MFLDPLQFFGSLLVAAVVENKKQSGAAFKHEISEGNSIVATPVLQA
jgi:hypothetical protein